MTQLPPAALMWADVRARSRAALFYPALTGAASLLLRRRPHVM